MKCIRNITIIFDDINTCLALNPNFVSHTAKSVICSSDLCQFSGFYLLKNTIAEILVLTLNQYYGNITLDSLPHILYSICLSVFWGFSSAF